METTSWKPKPKIIAAALVGGLVYVLGAFGVDLGVVLQDVSDVIDVDLPDPQALAAFLSAVIAGYIKTGDNTE
jgi:hypothetical protein